MAVVGHFALALVVVMATFTTAEMSTDVTRRPRPYLQPISPGGYRVWIVLLQTPTGAGGDNMDRAAHRAWHESFLPTKTTRDGWPRLRHSYTSVANGFSALLTDEEAKRVADEPGVVRVIPSTILYQQASRTIYGRHGRT